MDTSLLHLDAMIASGYRGATALPAAQGYAVGKEEVTQATRDHERSANNSMDTDYYARNAFRKGMVAAWAAEVIDTAERHGILLDPAAVY